MQRMDDTPGRANLDAGIIEMKICFLADIPAAIPGLVQAFAEEWPAPSTLIAARFHESAQREGLPSTLVALDGSDVLGTVSLGTRSVHSRPDLGPWLMALYVRPQNRRAGLGSALIAAAERQARAFELPRLYAGTSGAQSLFLRCGWSLLECVNEAGEPCSIFRKTWGG
ncbi:MAG TPA: GNAT family N-acetyltransferase [Steroidobacteraceae bacterium]|jgi:N-acetylglutamate synthase-like GNAT family acetyltransferase|nr:GNAT family N-acetyltransferase [Steroidobacteraceae bacterium]